MQVPEDFVEVSCIVADIIRQSPSARVESSNTDMDGVRGAPIVETVWFVTANSGEDITILHEARHPDSDRRCEHWVPKEARA